jgi:hypothetical protein
VARKQSSPGVSKETSTESADEGADALLPARGAVHSIDLLNFAL